MSNRNTRSRASRNGTAPESASSTATLEPAPAPEVEPAQEPAPAQQEPAQEPESAPAQEPETLDLDAVVEVEDIARARKVYREITARASLGDGRFTCVAREVRADGSEGPALISLIRVNEKEPRESERRESASYSSAKDMRLMVRALATVGVRFIAAS